MSNIIDDFHKLNWKNRNVKIVFDSDAAYKEGIQQALKRLRSVFIKLGANPQRVDLPYTPGVDKVGLDDFLVKNKRHATKAFYDLPCANLFMPDIITGKALLNKKFSKQQWVIQGLIPIGLTIMAGPPKVGKSWLVISLMAALTTGNRAIDYYETVACDALYLALEDTGSRLQGRLRLVAHGAHVNERSYFVTSWPNVENDGLLALERCLDEHPTCKVVFIDTFAKMRSAPTGKASLYHEDYEAASVLKQIADRRSIGIVVVHHLRKAASDDYVERVSGSTGITGAADTIMVLVRKRSDDNAILYITGRDIEEKQLAMKFNKGLWKAEGDAREVYLREIEEKIIEALTIAGIPMGPTDIAEAIGGKANSLMKTLNRMREDKLIEWHEGGKYTPTPKQIKKFSAKWVDNKKG